MKKIVIALLAVVLLAGLMPVGLSLAEDNYATVYSGNEFGVRLREGPATTYGIESILPSGTTVTVLETGTLWTRIQVGTRTGYMMSKFLVAGGSSSGVKVLTTATVFADNGLRTWLRSAPDGKRLGLYSDGTPVNILERGDTWCRVMIGSSIGYMMTRYLVMAPGPTPVPVPAFVQLSGVTVNYPYPLQGDTLLPIATPVEATYTCKWIRIDENGGTAQLSTNSAYSVGANDVGYKIKLEITGTGKYSGTYSTTTNPVTNSRKVTGVMIKNANTSHASPVIGDVLSTTIAPSSATVTFSWRVAGVEKSTASTYTVVKEDIGKAIQVYVTATGSFTGSASSAATTAVVDANTITSVKLSTSYPVVGQAVSAVLTPSGAKASYIWYVNGAPISTAASYTPSVFDLGDVISVKVTGTGGYSGLAASAESSPVCRTLLTGVTLSNAKPYVGTTISANVLPAAAQADGSVSYKWYANGKEVPGETTSSFTPSAYAGQTIYAVVSGEGVYGGKVTSAKTAAVATSPVLDSVSLNVTSPVVGDTITAALSPALDTAGAAKCTFVWQVGSSKIIGGTTYKVKDSDVGQQIRVQVNPGGGSIVTSSATSAVASTRGLDSISMFLAGNTASTGFSGTPQVGQQLIARVNPVQAKDSVTYSWYYESNMKAAIKTGNSYAVTEKDMGQKLVVQAVGNTTYLGKTVYTGAPKYTFNAVPKTEALKIKLDNTIIPEMGKVPVHSLNGIAQNAAGKNVEYKVAISWSPALNVNGTFKADTDYTATTTFTLPDGYRLGTVTADTSTGSTAPVGNVATLKFTIPASDQIVTKLSIAGVSTPVIGKAQGTTITSNAQYELETPITWQPADTEFRLGVSYKATIALKAKSGYTFTGLQTPSDGVFTIVGATKTSFTAVSPTQATIVAVFPATGSASAASVTASRTSVPVGSSKKFVQCEAALLNFSGDQSDVEWKWEMSGAYSEDTTIDQNGLLAIALDEIADRTITVTATTKNLASNKSATVTIKTVAETAVTGDVTVDIIWAPSEVLAGGTATYAAEVKNANNETVVWSVRGVDGDKKSGTKISGDGVLTISADESVKQLAVTARSVTGVTSTTYVTVVYADAPTRVAITTDQKSMSYGATGSFTVSISHPGTFASSKLTFVASDSIQSVTPNSVDAPSDTKTITVKVKDDPKLVGQEAWIQANYTETLDDGTTKSYHDKWAFMIVTGAQYDLTITPAKGSTDQIGNTPFAITSTPAVNGLNVKWDWDYTGTDITFDTKTGILSVKTLPTQKTTEIIVFATCTDSNGNGLGTKATTFTVINPTVTVSALTLMAAPAPAYTLSLTPENNQYTVEAKAGAARVLTALCNPTPEGAITYGWGCGDAGYIDEGDGTGTGTFIMGSKPAAVDAVIPVTATCWDAGGNKLCQTQIELRVIDPTPDTAATGSTGTEEDQNAKNGIALANALGSEPAAKTLTLSASSTEAMPGDIITITPTSSEPDELDWTCTNTANAEFTEPAGSAPFAILTIGPDAVPGAKYTVVAVSTKVAELHAQCTITVGGAAETPTDKVEETKVDETKVDETQTDETKTDETKTDETKTDETKTDETKTDETKTDETQTDETKVDETQTDETKTDETPIDKTEGEKPAEPVPATIVINVEEKQDVGDKPEEKADTQETTTEKATEQTDKQPAAEEKPKDTDQKKTVTYALTVTGGTGGGTYEPGDEVTIAAQDRSETHEVFVGWIGDVAVIPEAQRGDPCVIFTMPEKELSIEATYAPTYQLTVTGGTPTGLWYQEGAKVELTHAAAPEGSVFSRWAVTNATLEGNVLTMGTENASAKAVYAYSLKVSGGSADAGHLEPGKTATLTLDKTKIPEGKKFVKWTTDLGTLEAATSASAKITMPKTGAGPITVKATYKNASEPDETEEKTPAAVDTTTPTDAKTETVAPIQEEEPENEVPVGDHNPAI